MPTKIEQLKELKESLDQGLVSQAEYDQLRAEIIGGVAMPRMGATSRPFSIPPAPAVDRISFRNPVNGEIVTVEKAYAFGLTLIFGCFYLAYKEIWVHAGIAALLAIFTGGVSWFFYPFFAYRVIVDSYRRKGWIELPTPIPGPQGTGWVPGHRLD
jgi:hypothetical protein